MSDQRDVSRHQCANLLCRQLRCLHGLKPMLSEESSASRLFDDHRNLQSVQRKHGLLGRHPLLRSCDQQVRQLLGKRHVPSKHADLLCRRLRHLPIERPVCGSERSIPHNLFSRRELRWLP